MNYDWLFSFVIFAEHLNLTQAAKQLHITQPALHAQIRKLSEVVGAPLYHRQGKALVLTPSGERLAAFGRDTQHRGEDVLAEIRGTAPTRPLILASGQGAFLYLLGPAIQKFPKGRWPLRVVTLTGPQTLAAVVEARADVGVAVRTDVPQQLDAHRLRRVGQLALLPRNHPLAQRSHLAPEDLDAIPLIVAPQGSPHRTRLSSALTRAGARLAVAVEATGWELMLQFARYGLGIAVVNDFCPVPRGLVGVPLRGIPEVEYCVFTRSGQLHPGVETLGRAIRQNCLT